MPETPLPTKNPTTLINYSWQKVIADLFNLKERDSGLLLPEANKLRSTTTLKTMFARHGIPGILRSDNNPQFSSQEFTEAADRYKFTNTTLAALATLPTMDRQKEQCRLSNAY